MGRSRALTSLEDPPSAATGALRFRDRRDAGRRLAHALERFRVERPVVVGIARGGVPVAAEAARALDAPLDVALVRKVGAPQNPEFAIGAVAEGGVYVVSERTVHALGLSEEALRALVGRVEEELRERLGRYRAVGQAPPLAGRTAILIDDGLATGRSALAALRSLRARGASRVVLAVPVGSPDAVHALGGEADEVVCLEAPADMWAVGLWYEDFSPTSDEEVTALLAERAGAGVAAVDPEQREQRESAQPAVPLRPGPTLVGDLTIPARAAAIVVFAHGSGSSRRSPRNRAVARALNEAGFATLLLDLLTPAEEAQRANVLDIELLASRLVHASEAIAEREDVAGLPLAYFGASTGAAAALTAAAQMGERVRAVVSRGGRPDLARNLGEVRASTLLIVGEADERVLALNRLARRQLRCESELALVPGATHLFEEPGALEQVASLAVGWLARHTGVEA